MAILISHDFLYNVCLALSRCHSVSISLLSAYISLALSRLSPVSVALRLDLFPYHGTPSRFVDVVYVFPSLAVNLFISFILCPSLSHSLATHTLYRSLSVSLPISLSLVFSVSRFLCRSLSLSLAISPSRAPAVHDMSSSGWLSVAAHVPQASLWSHMPSCEHCYI